MSICRTSTPAYHGQHAGHFPETHDWLLSLLFMAFTGQHMPSPAQPVQTSNLCERIGGIFRSDTPPYRSSRTRD